MSNQGHENPSLDLDFTGIIDGLPFEKYLAANRVSKSTLWTLYDRSPAHARVEREPNKAMIEGTAIHCAVLEPDEFLQRFSRGPVNDEGRPINKNTTRWKELVEEHGEALLDAETYDNAMAIRDSANGNKRLRQLVGAGTVSETSGFWRDAETGLPCRLRMDSYVPGIGVGVDLKITTDARWPAFNRNAFTPLGYHVQEAFYTDGWRLAGGEINGFVFVAMEKRAPHAIKVYDIHPSAIAEGRAIYRKALDAWARCEAEDVWPAYPDEIETQTISRWAYNLTPAPEAGGEEPA